ncbi:MAG: hypothetical protein K0S32_806 [Bacteroidetes bacterium]|jgi:hypothetical protein|nr:hypothetical protein [Bacteroidota bacterium]
MYSLTNKQVDFILNDIGARGVKTEDLQYNLLDHICCMIENELEENGDFEQFYSKTISKFYKKELKELEDETQSLLTFKHYYTMKKIMFVSGFTSAFMLLAGGCFKIMHWPGAAMLMVLGTAILSFVFLPLMFTLKLREKTERRDKVVLIVGLFVSILLLLAAIFKVMHWPGATILSSSFFISLLLVFLPLFLITGLRNPATKLNTIVTSILIIAGSAYLLILPRNSQSLRLTQLEVNYLRNEESALKELTSIAKPDSAVKILLDDFMKKSTDLKNAIARAISEVDYPQYLADNENIRPHALTPEELVQFKETTDFITSLMSFEEKNKTTIYEYSAGENKEPLNRQQQLAEALRLQRSVQGLMGFITLMQEKACLSSVTK